MFIVRKHLEKSRHHSPWINQVPCGVPSPTQGPVPKPQPAPHSQCQHLPSPPATSILGWLRPEECLDGVAESRGLDEANPWVRDPEGHVHRGAVGKAKGPQVRRQPRSGPGTGLRHSPVQDHQDHGAIRAQERRVLQVTAVAPLGHSQPHALRALGDELAAGTAPGQGWGPALRLVASPPPHSQPCPT